MAAENGHLDVVKVLIAAGAQPITDSQGHTALFMACQFGRPEVVQFLLSRNAQTNQQAISGVTALIQASVNGHINIVNMLLAQGANPNVQTAQDGLSALYLAAQNGHVAVVDALLTHNAQIDLANVRHVTPLLVAAEHNQVAVVDTLLRHGANPNIRSARTTTPLMIASIKNNADVVRLLLHYGADAAIADGAGNTPLMFAAGEAGNIEIVRMLLSIISIQKIHEKIEFIAASGNDPEIMHLMVQELVDAQLQKVDQLIAQRNNQGQTARDLALRFNRPAIAQLLDVNLVNREQLRAVIKADVEQRIKSHQ